MILRTAGVNLAFLIFFALGTYSLATQQNANPLQQQDMEEEASKEIDQRRALKRIIVDDSANSSHPRLVHKLYESMTSGKESMDRSNDEFYQINKIKVVDIKDHALIDFALKPIIDSEMARDARLYGNTLIFHDSNYLTLSMINSHIYDLYKSGRFYNIFANLECTEEKCYELNLIQNPFIKKLKIRSNVSDKDQIRSMLGIKQNEYLSNNLLSRYDNAIQSSFASSYSKINANFISSEDRYGNINLTLDINATGSYTVNNILVSGNTVFDTDTILLIFPKFSVITPLDLLQQTATFHTGEVRNVEQNITNLYNRYGYMDAEVMITPVYDLKGNGIHLMCHINENKRWVIRNVLLNVEDAISESSKSQIESVEISDRIYSPTTKDNLLAIIKYILHGNQESAIITVDPLITRETDDTVIIDVKVNIKASRERKLVKHILIDGLSKSPEHVIFAASAIHPGDYYDASVDLERINNSMTRSGRAKEVSTTFTNPSADFGVKYLSETPESTTAIVRLKEPDSNMQFQFSADPGPQGGVMPHFVIVTQIIPVQIKFNASSNIFSENVSGEVSIPNFLNRDRMSLAFGVSYSKTRITTIMTDSSTHKSSLCLNIMLSPMAVLTVAGKVEQILDAPSKSNLATNNLIIGLITGFGLQGKKNNNDLKSNNTLYGKFKRIPLILALNVGRIQNLNPVMAVGWLLRLRISADPLLVSKIKFEARKYMQIGNGYILALTATAEAMGDKGSRSKFKSLSPSHISGIVYAWYYGPRTTLDKPNNPNINNDVVFIGANRIAIGSIKLATSLDKRSRLFGMIGMDAGVAAAQFSSLSSLGREFKNSISIAVCYVCIIIPNPFIPLQIRLNFPMKLDKEFKPGFSKFQISVWTNL